MSSRVQTLLRVIRELLNLKGSKFLWGYETLNTDYEGISSYFDDITEYLEYNYNPRDLNLIVLTRILEVCNELFSTSLQGHLSDMCLSMFEIDMAYEWSNVAVLYDEKCRDLALNMADAMRKHAETLSQSNSIVSQTFLKIAATICHVPIKIRPAEMRLRRGADRVNDVRDTLIFIHYGTVRIEHFDTTETQSIRAPSPKTSVDILNLMNFILLYNRDELIDAMSFMKRKSWGSTESADNFIQNVLMELCDAKTRQSSYGGDLTIGISDVYRVLFGLMNGQISLYFLRTFDPLNNEIAVASASVMLTPIFRTAIENCMQCSGFKEHAQYITCVRAVVRFIIWPRYRDSMDPFNLERMCYLRGATGQIGKFLNSVAASVLQEVRAMKS